MVQTTEEMVRETRDRLAALAASRGHREQEAAQLRLDCRETRERFGRLYGVDHLRAVVGELERRAAERPTLTVHDGGRTTPRKPRRGRDALTPREADVAEAWVARGQAGTDAAVAAMLGLTAGTVGKYASRILLKLGARDRRHAVAILLGEDVPVKTARAAPARQRLALLSTPTEEGKHAKPTDW